MQLGLPEIVKHRLREWRSPLCGWFLVALLWTITIGAYTVLTSFRAVTNSGISQAFQPDDVPLIKFFFDYYARIYWGTVGGTALFWACFGLVLALLRRRQRSSVDSIGGQLRAEREDAGPIGRWLKSPWPLVSVGTVMTLLEAFSLFCTSEKIEAGQFPDIRPMDWAIVLLTPLASWLMMREIVRSAVRLDDFEIADRTENHQKPLPPESPRAETSRAAPSKRESVAFRLGVIYLLSLALISIYAVLDHQKFWDSTQNGNYEYRPFFASEEEVETANMVFYSTSLLFASISASLGGAGFLFFRGFTRRGRNECRLIRPPEVIGLASLVGLLWASMIGVPWEMKILPEIIAERGWIMPAVVLTFSASGIASLAAATMLMLRRDYLLSTQDYGLLSTQDYGLLSTQDYGISSPQDSACYVPRRSEFTLATIVLFPVYPLLRVFRLSWTRWNIFAMLVIVGGVIGGLVYSVNMIDEWFDFDDWRGMLRQMQFPTLRVFLSLMSAWLIYQTFQFALSILQLTKEGRVWGCQPWFRILVSTSKMTTIGITATILLAAPSPFWRWDNVSKNVFARCVEHSNRHAFELTFLHWLFDFDRDGFSAVLHGADTDDFDPDVQCAGMMAPAVIEVPIDEFAIVDDEASRQKVRDFPNIVMLFLEGVTPRSVSAYKQRKLTDAATPYIDSVAADGTLFTEARTFYPSTWDAWFATLCGRHLYVHENHISNPFRNRYSRYNNLYKVLELAGINRWCHANMYPFHAAYVPMRMRGKSDLNWEADYYSGINAEKSAAGFRRGDNRNQRMLRFLDSIDLKRGDKFFMCEHMADTHFPWEPKGEISAKQLKKLTGLKLQHDLPFYGQDNMLSSGTNNGKYAKYLQTISRMDAQIGQLLDKLKERKLYDNTMIIIVSDHGCQWWEHEHLYYVSHLYKQSLHIPLIIKPAKTTYDGHPLSTKYTRGGWVTEPVMQIDILPMIMEMVGARLVNPKKEYPFYSRSIWPLLVEKKTRPQIHPETFWKRDILLKTHFDMLGVLSDFRYKLIFHRTSGTYLLFDLKEDPEEMHSLVDEHPELLKLMMEKMKNLIKVNPAFIGQIKL